MNACGHVLGDSCLRDWASTQRPATCPLCRAIAIKHPSDFQKVLEFLSHTEYFLAIDKYLEETVRRDIFANTRQRRADLVDGRLSMPMVLVSLIETWAIVGLWHFTMALIFTILAAVALSMVFVLCAIFGVHDAVATFHIFKVILFLICHIVWNTHV